MRSEHALPCSLSISFCPLQLTPSPTLLSFNHHPFPLLLAHPLFKTSFRSLSSLPPSNPLVPRFHRSFVQTMPSNNHFVRLAKWTVGYKEDAPETISSSSYIKELTENPGEGVSFSFTRFERGGRREGGSLTRDHLD